METTGGKEIYVTAGGSGEVKTAPHTFHNLPLSCAFAGQNGPKTIHDERLT